MVHESDRAVVAVVGLGYVGLPLAVSFARSRRVIGFDINPERIAELTAHHDRTREVDADALASAVDLSFTTDPAGMAEATVFIITAPTPIDRYKNPDMGAVLAATRSVASVLKPGDVVVYESTVYPGATEEECVPLLEAGSGLRFNDDFFVGYSPERINPGDREHRFENILKVTSGSTPEAADFVDALYASVVTAGTYKASSIRVAEAAKVIENTQRDVNIALINELAILFGRLGIDTQEVLEAAATKWNFLPFKPGLVGGHCIGVDPYYLTHKAREVGYHPEVILAGRRLNDSMGQHVASQLILEMLRRRMDLRSARVLVLGLSFKENTPDIRNTRVVDVVSELADAGLAVDVHDPWVTSSDAAAEYDLKLVAEPEAGAYDAVVLAVAHADFLSEGAEGIRRFGKQSGSVVYDLKSVLPKSLTDLRL